MSEGLRRTVVLICVCAVAALSGWLLCQLVMSDYDDLLPHRLRQMMQGRWADGSGLSLVMLEMSWLPLVSDVL